MGRRGVCRHDHGIERALLQLQGIQLEAPRPALGDPRRSARLFTGRHAPIARALHAFLRLLALRLRHVGAWRAREVGAARGMTGGYLAAPTYFTRLRPASPVAL